MKINWPACRPACVVLVGLAIIASPMRARPDSPTQTVEVDTQVSAQAVRIETKASGPFRYTTYRPSDSLLVVNLVGVSTAQPIPAQTLNSSVVNSYRVVQYGAGSSAGVRLEVLLRRAVEPRFERLRPNQLAVVFDEKAVRPVLAATRLTQPLATGVASVTTVIGQIEIAREGQQPAVRVHGNGRLTPRASRLTDPDRLVLDFTGARLAVTNSAISSDDKPVRGVRARQFKSDVARVVIDLDRAASYKVVAGEKVFTVRFAVPVPVPRDEPASQRTSAGAPAPTSAKPAEAAQPSAPQLTIDGASMPLPRELAQRTEALGRLASQAEAPSASDKKPAQGQTPVPGSGQGQTTPTQPAPQAPAPQQPPAPTPQPGRYSGEPISVNLKDVDLRDFFRLIHEISGLNVVLDPGVKGSLTIVLDDVPWDQALDIVLKNNGLEKQLEGNVLRIATQEAVKKEAEVKRDLAKAQAEAIDQVTTTRVLSYSKASSIRDTLKRFLSARGEILSDERSNSLIIRDIPSVLPVIDNLIRQLDRKTQQVEIEARVVAASRSFARDIGSQFGFGTTTTGRRSIFSGASGVGTSPISCAAPCPLPLPPLIVSGTTSMPLNTNLGANAPTSGASFIHRSPNFALDYVITAAESKGVGKLLSKPKVITQNNEKATVKQGTKIPIQTTINNTISVQFIDAVLKLEVTPQITAEGTVFMEVLVENTQIDNGIPRVQGIPALNTQSAETKVLITDGGTVVIGGVIISSQRTDIKQVPLVGSIPLIGHLFKNTAVNVQSQELLFFLTPRVVPS